MVTNETSVEYPRDQCITRLFEEWVARSPEAVAVICGENRLTYRELNARANRLARKLTGLGVGPEVPVGICVERSVEMVIGLLGILKAAGAYVPLDPGYPAERLSFMLEDSRVNVLVCDRSSAEQLPDHGTPRVCLGGEPELSAPDGEKDLESSAAPENLAYVIYTSGSTGRPKGVAVEHRSVVNLVWTSGKAFDFGPRDVWTFVHSFGFDFSVWEIWGCLCSGGRLIVVPLAVAQSPREFYELVRREHVTVLNQTPSALRNFLLAASEECDLGASDLRMIVCGGEAFPRELASDLLQWQVPVWNFYGPTEATVWATNARVDDVDSSGAWFPLGRPMANMQVHVLDEHLFPAPIGASGELYIGGEGVARGYWNRPELTEERFLPDPFTPRPGGRLYRTGDLARLREDGQLEFLGRTDHQVKVRGFRIELGEIEAALAQDPDVRESVVVAREDETGDKSLIAYIVPRWESAAPALPELESRAASEQVGQWRTVYEAMYADASVPAEPGFDIVGWTSSYSDEGIPAEEMREWVEGTVERIVSLKPRRVLEIGCGTGLLLQRVAPLCSEYIGTDYSATGLARLRRQLEMASIPGVTLMQREASDFSGLEEGRFDLVILNSVAQYFPRVEYFIEVLRGAARLLAPRGSIFVGDLRNLPLLPAFHASVELHRAPPSLPMEEFRRRVHQAVTDETELVIAPALFRALRGAIPALRRVQVVPRRGAAANELTRFRYDAILRCAGDSDAAADVHWLDWGREGLDVRELHRRLEQDRPELLAVSRVANARVASEVRILDLAARGGLRTVADLRRALAQPRDNGVDPEEIWAIARDQSYEVQLDWAESDSKGQFDVVFRRPKAFPSSVPTWSIPARSSEPAFFRSWDSYANRPLARTFFRDLVPRLRKFLGSRLPEYMVPSSFVCMDSLPLTANGKLDIRALPPPERTRVSTGSAYLAPRTPTEELVAQSFRDVLAIDRVGVEDDFFDLGGHSLKGAQVISRIRQTFGVKISIRFFFESPTVCELARHIDRLVQSEEPDRFIPSLRRRDRHRVEFPLSFAQERLWFFDQLEPGSSAYNIGRAVRLRGKLDSAALSRALDAIVARHESLRTVFRADDGRPVQVVLPKREIPLDLVDLAQANRAIREREAARRIEEGVRRTFDLARGPLLATTLLRLDEQEHILLLAMHHIVSDEWSLGVLFGELASLYEAFSAGRPSPLPELPIQYTDFALWQRDTLSATTLQSSLDYWRTQMDGAPPYIDLPLDRSRPAKSSFFATSVSRTVSPQVLRALKALSRREGTTLFMTLLAALSVVLSRLSCQDDIVLGSPIVERNRIETEGLIGFFLNTLALRIDLSGNPSFRELLGRVRRVALDAFAHEVPFEKLVEALQPNRDLSRTPVFQVFFNMLNVTAGQARLAGLTIEPVQIPEVASRFDVTLYAEETAEGIRLSSLYNRDLFEPTRMNGMLEQLSNLLEQIAAAPENRIGSYSLLTGSARVLLPDPTAPIREPKLPIAADDFLSWTERAGSAPAVVQEGRIWTYADLAQSSRAVAVRLLSEGLRPGDVVGVAGRRNFGLIASMVGVLRSGGVLLTLDPSLPVERRKLMLSEARARYVVRVGDLAGVDEGIWRDLPGSLPIDVDQDGGPGKRESPNVDQALPHVRSDDPAYVFFTSGTSGVPKAVVGSHKGLAHFLKWQRETFEVGPGDRCAQLTALSFDVVLRDVFLPLTSGASLHLPGRDQDTTSGRILSWLEREGITVLHTVPSVAQSWLAAPSADARLGRLRWAFFAGEPLTDTLVRRWFAALPGAGRIVNLYGPTETTLAKCFFLVPEDPPAGIQPVGRPLPETQAWILNQDELLCGIGEVGEIVLRTPFRSLGYGNAPEEQRERFVANPFRREKDDVVYRTGDRGRYRLDGSLAILGRWDDQVKIRGVRVEPAEVAAAFSQHPSVADCAVVPRMDDNGETLLAAYVVRSPAGSVTAAELRAHLSSRLPAAMMPSAFVFLNELPLTPNGKLNRAALPPPELAAVQPGEELEPPRTPVEEVIASVWATILGVEQIGVHDNFFELGGHSLKATQVVSRLGQAFGLDLPVRALFEAPTLASLASSIETSLLEEVASAGSGQAPHGEAGASTSSGRKGFHE